MALCGPSTVRSAVHLGRKELDAILGGDDNNTPTCIIHRLCHILLVLPASGEGMKCSRVAT